MSATSRRPEAVAPVSPAVAEPAAHTLSIGVIGAGRVGAVLAAALRRAGHPVVGATARSTATRDRVRRLLPDVPVRDALRVARAADVVLLAVPDDTLAPLVGRLAPAGAFRAGQVVAHTSGAHGVGVLAPATVAGAHPMALHPAMTFTGDPGDLDRLPGTSYGVTTVPALRPLAEHLVVDLAGTPEWVPEQSRPLYHAALAHGANHLVTLVNEALDRLRDAGVRDPEKVAAPLLRAALDNALRLRDAALTGPVSRGDSGTVARHLAALAEVAPDSVPSYVELARRTADRAIASGRLHASDAGSLLDALAATRAHVPARGVAPDAPGRVGVAPDAPGRNG
jgi:predicted short-subunit dehydrogenase-like oxidoreductase (DUF2520 family)